MVLVALVVMKMVQEQQVMTLEGTPVSLKAETICLHGDTSDAVNMARRLRAALDANGL